MGGRLYGFQGSGSSHTDTIDVGADFVYKSGNANSNMFVIPGAIAMCLYIQSGGKWIPCKERMLRNT